MAIALPIGIDKRFVGTCFIADEYDGKLLFLTTLHQMGVGKEYIVGLPEHMGDMNKTQKYPTATVNYIITELLYTDPILDIAVLISKTKDLKSKIPNFISKSTDIFVGESVIVAGYPYIGLGSMLETAEICNISAIGQRLFMGLYPVNELVISHQTLAGSSGSPVIKRSDGTICGMIRGCLAPPEVISIGNMPIGTDSNITYVINSCHFKTAIDEAKRRYN